MTVDTKERRGGRPRGARIEVWVTPEERAEIAARADRAGLSLSAYMRAAGLLKLWLAEKPGQGARQFEVDQMMTEFRTMQAELSGIMGRAVK